MAGSDPGPSGQASRKRIAGILESKDQDRAMAELQALAPRKIISALQGLLCAEDRSLKWKAVKALGAATARLAETDMEAARTVMRRWMWSLNEESGGCAWGAPEAMAESMAGHRGLAEEFANLLVSFIAPEGMFLDYEPLQRGAVWGIGRLAERHPDLLTDAPPYLAALLGSPDPAVRGLAARALGMLSAKAYISELSSLAADESEVTFFDGREEAETSVGQLARQALEFLRGTEQGD